MSCRCVGQFVTFPPYVVVVAPVISGISPSSGSTAGGVPVTITGSGFIGATAATVGGVALTNFQVHDDSTITGVTGAHVAGAVDVVVTNPAGSNTDAGAFTYANPVVTSATPNSGPAAGGTPITIAGSNFTGATSATVGGVAVTSFVVVNDTTITCVTGTHAAATVNIVVTNPISSGTGTNKFTYT